MSHDLRCRRTAWLSIREQIDDGEDATRSIGLDGRVHFRAQPAVDPLKIIRMIQREPRAYRLDGQDKLRIAQALPDNTARITFAQLLLERLGPPLS